MRPVPLRQELDNYIEDIRAGGNGRGGKKMSQGKKTSKKFRDGECEMTFLECATSNASVIVDAVGSERYETCLQNIPNLCVEDWKARKICGVSITCQ